MNYVGIDLHQKTIVRCALDPDRRVVARRTFPCGDPDAILEFFRGLGPFQAVVEATASYEWPVEALEPIADRVVLAPPGKIPEIARGEKKADHPDAFVLAEERAKDEVPPAPRPPPRPRPHRALVRHRQYLKPSAPALKNKMRRIAADSNADRKDLFTAAGGASLAKVKSSDADRFVLDQLHAQGRSLEDPVLELARRLKAFAAPAPAEEAEARAELRTAPGIGPVTSDGIVSELGDGSRFPSAKAVCAYAGLGPGVRPSSDRRKDLPITKAGAPRLRWVPVEASWPAVRHSAARRRVDEGIRKRAGGQKAIVAGARRRPCVLSAMPRDGTHSAFGLVGRPTSK
jgi:transposase